MRRLPGPMPATVDAMLASSAHDAASLAVSFS